VGLARAKVPFQAASPADSPLECRIVFVIGQSASAQHASRFAAWSQISGPAHSLDLEVGFQLVPARDTHYEMVRMRAPESESISVRELLPSFTTQRFEPATTTA